MKFKIVLLILATILLSCKSEKNTKQIEVVSIAPATYYGVIPCADCEGIELQINLQDDFTFMTKRVALGKSRKAHIVTGRWEFNDSSKTIILVSINQSPKRFAITSDTIIEMLDIHGKKIVSELNYTLEKKDKYEMITEAFPMKGMFRYLADVTLFIDCSSQKKYPVAMEKDYVLLEKEYLSKIEEAGESMLATLSGRLILRPKMEGNEKTLTLVVEKFDKVWYKLDCKNSLSTALLKNTYWKLININSKPIKVPKSVREPHFILRTDGKNLKGFGGCNNFMGTYEIKENRIKFGPFAGTRKFCKKTMDLENSFMKVFSEVNNYKIFGEVLELYRDEKILAKFESVYF